MIKVGALKEKMLKRKTHIAVLIVNLVLLLALCGCGVISREIEALVSNEDIIANGYLPLDEAMEICGYKKTSSDATKYAFTQKINGGNISIEFLFDEGKCLKNEYQFDLSGTVLELEKQYYIQKDKIKEIVNMEIAYEGKRLTAKPIEYEVHEWTTAFMPVVAHAGGGYREAHQNNIYTNLLDTTIQNYNLGHRVLEFDFMLTTDGALAATYNWKNENGEEEKKTAQQWLEQTEVNGVVGRTMLIGDIMDQMMVNKDMFMITDTKIIKVGEDMKKQFQIIREEAMKRDPELLKRIIPQIYNMKMYDVITEIYPFQSIIFTFYQTKGVSDDELFEFVSQHDDIKVVTTWYDERGRFDVVRRLNEQGKLAYAHTVNSYEEIAALKEKGIHGIYSDYLLPRDWQTYIDISK